MALVFSGKATFITLLACIFGHTIWPKICHTIHYIVLFFVSGGCCIGFRIYVFIENGKFNVWLIMGIMFLILEELKWQIRLFIMNKV